MQISAIAGTPAGAAASQPAAVTSQSATPTTATSGRAAPQDVVSLSNAAKQAMQTVDDGDGPGR